MPANPPSYNRFCSSLALRHDRSSSRGAAGGASLSMAGMLFASHSLARAANSATDSVGVIGCSSFRRTTRLLELVYAQIMFLRRPERAAVQRDPAEVQVQVVFPRDADAAVHLHTRLHDLARHLAHVGLGDAGRQIRFRRTG